MLEQQQPAEHANIWKCPSVVFYTFICGCCYVIIFTCDAIFPDRQNWRAVVDGWWGSNLQDEEKKSNLIHYLTRDRGECFIYSHFDAMHYSFVIYSHFNCVKVYGYLNLNAKSMHHSFRMRKKEKRKQTKRRSRLHKNSLILLTSALCLEAVILSAYLLFLLIFLTCIFMINLCLNWSQNYTSHFIQIMERLSI